MLNNLNMRIPLRMAPMNRSSGMMVKVKVKVKVKVVNPWSLIMRWKMTPLLNRRCYSCIMLYPCLLVDLIVFSSLCFDYTKHVWGGVVSGGPH